jgi:hypothetical protein
MKKSYVLAISLLITAFQLNSQTRDVLYLKNGSIINGSLIEITDNQYKIRTSDKSIFVFKSEEVEKYVKSSSGFECRKKSGFGMALESGFLMGSPDETHPMPFSFNCLVNYTLKSSNIFGIGSGVEFISDPYMPVFIEYKRLIMNRKTAPFLFARGGSILHLRNDGTNNYNYQYDPPVNKYKNGVSLTIGTGISWCHDYSETYLSFAYRYATTSYIQNVYNNPPVTYLNYYNRLEIKFGFKF